MAATAAAALIAIALGAAFLRVPAPTTSAPIHASVPIPAGLELDGSGPPVPGAVARWTHPGVPRAARRGYQRLYVRRLDEDEATVVPGSETAEGPFFSPDGRWLAFAVGVSITGIHPPELRKYSLDTKLTQTIATVEDYFGGYWSDNGSIVFVGTQPRGIYSVPSGGGTPTPLVGQVRIDGKDQARALAWPEPLPGGSALLITDWGTSSFGTVAVLDLATRELASLGLEGSGARFVPGGYIVYGSRNASLMVVPFDPATRRTTGTPVALMQDVGIGRNNVPAFAVSASGTFLYTQGYVRWSRREPLRMIRVTAAGTTTALPFEPLIFRRGFALSPAGDAIIAGTWDDSRWLFDLERRTRTKLPIGGTVELFQMAWSPDGRRLRDVRHGRRQHERMECVCAEHRWVGRHRPARQAHRRRDSRWRMDAGQRPRRSRTRSRRPCQVRQSFGSDPTAARRRSFTRTAPCRPRNRRPTGAGSPTIPPAAATSMST